MDREQLIDLYWNSNLSISQIATECNISIHKVKWLIEKYKIKTRTRSEALKLRPPFKGKHHSVATIRKIHTTKCGDRHTDISKITDYIDGLLLSDGNLYKTSSLAARYSQVCKNKEWLETIQKILYSANIDSRIFPDEITINGPLHRLITLSYPELKGLYERWYPHGKKWVPRDIILTPECVANWYMGDGTPLEWGVRICINDIRLEDALFLSELLNSSFNVHTHYHKNNGVYIPQGELSVFFQYISKYVVSCYNYKLKDYNGGNNV